MAIVENRSSAIGDVIRIETDVPVVGIVSLTSFMDDTEGENIGTKSGVIPPFDPGTRLSGSAVVPSQVGVNRFCLLNALDGSREVRGVGFLDTQAEVWDTNFPDTQLRICRVYFQDPYIYTTFSYSDTSVTPTIQYIYIERLDINNRGAGWERIDDGSFVGRIFHTFRAWADRIYDNKIYFFTFITPKFYLYYFDLLTNTFSNQPVTEFPLELSVNNMDMITIDPDNGVIYSTYRIYTEVQNQFYIYDINQNTWKLSSTSPNALYSDMYYQEGTGKIWIYSIKDDRYRLMYYDVGSDTWWVNGPEPPITSYSYISTSANYLYVRTNANDVYVYDTNNNVWISSVDDSGARYFEKKFRYSVDGGMTFTPFYDLNELNIQNIKIDKEDAFVIEATYQRVGEDPTGTIAFNSFTIDGIFEDLKYPIYDSTIFRRLFPVNDPNVLGWAINVLEKLYQRGILPEYVTRNMEDVDDRDFISYWYSVTHLFAILVYWARNYENLASRRLMLIEYLNNFDIGIHYDMELEDLAYIFANRPDEYRKRGTDRITYAKDENGEEIDGELLRLLNKQEDDFLLFALIEAHKFGWCIGESSPTWTGTENIKNLTLAYEYEKEVEDLALYPLNNSSYISIVNDATIGLDVMLISGHSGAGTTGIGSLPVSSPNRDYLILIDPGIDYEISFKVKRSGTNTNDKLMFNAYGYDENYIQKYLDPITGTDTNSNSFSSIELDQKLLVADTYYWFRGVLHAAGTTLNSSYKLNFINGRGLLLREDVKYISFAIGSSGVGSVSDLYIYDVKMRPLNLPISQGLFGVKNIIAGYMKNGGELNDEDLRLFIQNKLIPYNSFLLPKYL